MNINKTISLGELQTLEVVKTTDFGVYLAGSESKEHRILLPKKQVPEHTKIGDKITVFVYKDSEDRLIATTTEPLLKIGEVAKLEVKEASKIGAFLDWGLPKDLLLPFKEQTGKVEKGDHVLVTLYIDKSHRLAATMKVYDYLKTDSPYKKDDIVTGVVYEISEQFGAFVAVDDIFSALIKQKELFIPLKVGQTITARVLSVNEDNKLNLSLRKKSYVQVNDDKELIYKRLTDANGFLPYHDKSSPDAIKKEFNLSKNAFKRALGGLLKEQKIKQDDKGIYLI